MGRVWQMQEAKNKLSEVVDRALRDGPQVITRRGKRVAVVMAAARFDEQQQLETSLVDFFQSSPLVGVDLDCERDEGLGRDVELSD